MTGTIRIFRMEDEEGRGPFRAGITSVLNDVMTGDRDADWHADMPSSTELFGRVSRGFVCGTTTLREMVRWFPRPMRRALACYGYGLSVYDVPADSVIRSEDEGAMQVMFVPVDCVASEWNELRMI